MQRSAGLWIVTGLSLVFLTGAAFALVGRGEAPSRDGRSADGTAAHSGSTGGQGSEMAATGYSGGNNTKSGAGNIGVENPFPDRRKAVSLDGGTGWLNTSGEITLRDLRGKVVLLDFWTYCCINCMHVLPDLKFLEKKYANELVVIGVHSAKFENEKDTENIRRAVQRYEIEHPVINDSRMILWQKYGASSWPTLVLIDPEGYYCGYISGEGKREILDAVLSRVIKYHKAKGTLDETPIRFDLEREKLKPTPLKFPGKVLADEGHNRLFIADTNHNRIVISSLDGRLIDVVGTGVIGAKDGAYDSATFDHPQGMVLVDETLYVADTENHLIRTVDLKNKRVSTLAGTGRQANFRATGGVLKRTALNSPWALEHVDGTLYIAMAGPHQIWSHKLGSNTIRVHAGSGREDITDGPLAKSALAQPSSLTTDGKFLYVADSEGSAIRRVSLNSRGGVTTVVGPSGLPFGRSLFEFGDIDGAGGKARLQHPLGVVYNNGSLYVADSYNHKIKKITLKTKTSEIKTLLGDGKPGNTLSPLRFSEPGGLSYAGNRLYIADTNNHRVLIVDLKDLSAFDLTIQGLNPPELPESDDSQIAYASIAMKVVPQKVAAGDALDFKIKLNLPQGYKLNKLAPVSYRVKADDGQKLIASDHLDKRHRINDLSTESDETLTLSIPLDSQSGKAVLELALSFGYCRGGTGGLCKIQTSRWQIPVEVSDRVNRRVIELEVKIPKTPGTAPILPRTGLK